MAIFVAFIDAEVIVKRFVSDDFILILVITDLKGSRVSEKVLAGMIDKWQVELNPQEESRQQAVKCDRTSGKLA